MNDIFLGNQQGEYFVGGTPVDSIYMGATLVYNRYTPEPDYRALKFSMVNSAETNNLSIFKRGTWTVNLEYSLDGAVTWTEWDYENNSLTFGNGVDLYLRGKNPEGFGSGNNTRSFQSFGDGLYTVSGNIMHLLDWEQDLQEFQNSGQTFYMLFGNEFNKKLYSVSGLTLPATTLNNYCYTDMFLGCENLIDTPELPATTLARECYFRMFQGCTSLTEAPELPATSLLANSCYRWMFQNCTSLTEVPVITHDGEEIGGACCYGMFENCTSLTHTPEMNIDYSFSDIRGGGDCFREMFKGCTSMTDAVLFDRPDYINYCYGMFSGCTSLTSITCNFSGVTRGGLTNWVAGVASAGTFYRSSALTEEAIEIDSPNGIPSGWTVSPPFEQPEIKALKFSTVNPSDTNTLSLNNTGGNAPNLEYSTDGGNTWTTWDYSGLTFGNGTDLYIRGNNPSGFSQRPKYSRFVFSNSTAKVNCTGNIMHLLDYTQDLDTIPCDYCYYNMFDGCTSLTEAPELPATTLAESCYMLMFAECSNLTTAPELPATTLANECYADMFRVCTSLTEAPELPATTLARECYFRMFRGCTSLTEAPELPATTLAESCYMLMFAECSNLTTAPELPATTLAEGCYTQMFSECSGLTTAPELPAMELSQSCYSSMFEYCTSLTQAPELPATTLANECYSAMFYECSSLTTAPELPATTLADYCYFDMFQGCTSLTEAPELPATTLAEGCYMLMFAECSNLTSITADFVQIDTDSLFEWVIEVASTGVFHRNPNLSESSIERGDSGIPEGWTVAPPF